MYQEIFSKGIVLRVLALSIIFPAFLSCKKGDSDTSSSLSAEVRVNVSVGDPEEGRLTVASNRTVRRTAEPNVQSSTVQLGGGRSLEVELHGSSYEHLGASPSGSGSRSSGAASAVVQERTKALGEGVRYRVAVYADGGKHIVSHDYAVGKGNPKDRFPLDAGNTYTFLVYSVNSQTELPDIQDGGSISTAKLVNVKGSLMFFKKTLELGFGETDLSAVLQHQFSQITTIVEMDNSMTGSIESIQGMQIGSAKESATLNFSDGSLSYPQGAVSSTVTFPSIEPGSRVMTSNPVALISPQTSSATLKIASLRIDSETKTNISVPGIKIVPGHRYSLVLRFRTCSEDVTAEGLNWRYAQTSWTEGNWFIGYKTYTGIYKTDEGRYYKNNEVIRNVFSAPRANYGFQFDITEMDNAFNMSVNGQYIFGSSDQEQVQFETASSLGITRNIQFADGSEYTKGGIDQVYNMKGTLNAPLLRIMISRSGEVTMLGSKTNGGPLFPLKLMGGQSFKRVVWNSEGENKVVVTQKVAGRTIIVGKGSGKKRISCP
jgi:hypothetical protein